MQGLCMGTGGANATDRQCSGEHFGLLLSFNLLRLHLFSRPTGGRSDKVKVDNMWFSGHTALQNGSLNTWY